MEAITMEATTPFTPRVAVISRHRIAVLVLVALLLCAGIVLDLLLARFDVLGASRVLLPTLVFPFVEGVVALFIFARWPKEQMRGVLSVIAEGLALDGKLVVPRDRIKDAFRLARGPDPSAGALVQLRSHGSLPWEVQFDAEADAQALIESLAKGSRHATLAFGGVRLGARLLYGSGAAVSLSGLVLVAWILAAVGAGHHLEPARNWLAVFGVVAAGWVVALLTQVCTVRVGADGVLVQRALGTEFYRYAEVTGVRRDGWDVVLQLASGKIVRVAVEGSRPIAATANGAADALVVRITEARALCLAGASPSDLAGELARGGRDVLRWVQGVRDLIDGSTSYRTPTVPRDRFWAVLEDPTQPASARAGAAVALRARLDDGERSRLRVAKEACALRELTGALDAIEENDDQRIERALRSLRA